LRPRERRQFQGRHRRDCGFALRAKPTVPAEGLRRAPAQARPGKNTGGWPGKVSAQKKKNGSAPALCISPRHCLPGTRLIRLRDPKNRIPRPGGSDAAPSFPSSVIFAAAVVHWGSDARVAGIVFDTAALFVIRPNRRARHRLSAFGFNSPAGNGENKKKHSPSSETTPFRELQKARSSGAAQKVGGEGLSERNFDFFAA